MKDLKVKNKKMNYEFIGKTLFFPDYGILVVGDLHIGYEYSLVQAGVLIPENQIKELKEELIQIFQKIKKDKKKLKKIIFLGDIKHSFKYEYKEKNYFKEISDFLKSYAVEKNIIFIRGNHDTIDYSYGKMKNYFFYKDLAFVHGHKEFSKVFQDKIKMIVMGHIHPSVILKDKQNIKREKYKCFLVGKFKRKKVIILPSFLTTIEGTPINDYKEEYEDYFSIIPKKSLMKFDVFVVNEKGKEVYGFGKLEKLKLR